MSRALFPFHCYATPAAIELIGGDLPGVAVLALKATLKNGHGLEIAHQQVRYRGHDLAFSCRVTANGELIFDIDVGDPHLRDRIVLESELRQQTRRIRGISR